MNDSEKLLKDFFEEHFGYYGLFGYRGKIRQTLRNAKYWVLHRTTDKYHVVKTDLEPGYYDVDHRMLHAVMALVCTYVEKEQGGDLELEKWAKELLANPDPNAPELTDSQAKKDLSIIDIYRWWKIEYPFDCKTRDIIVHELFGNYHRGMKFTDAQEKQYDVLRKLEDKIDSDEQKYLHKAIDLRRGMWT